MDSYVDFAEFYDELTLNIDYEKNALYIDKLIKKYNKIKKEKLLILDLACGTGSLALQLFDIGYDVLGVDYSVSMLNKAYEKSEGKNIIYVNQSMDKLDLPYNIDVVVCALDSINHLSDFSKVKETFKKISKFLNKGGLFIFDVNTYYKHKKVLGNNTFVFETENIYCVWQNFYDNKEKHTEIYLDFFKYSKNNKYARKQVDFFETYYSKEKLKDALNNASLNLLDIFEENSFNKPNEKTERKVYIARKEIENEK